MQPFLIAPFQSDRVFVCIVNILEPQHTDVITLLRTCCDDSFPRPPFRSSDHHTHECVLWLWRHSPHALCPKRLRARNRPMMMRDRPIKTIYAFLWSLKRACHNFWCRRRFGAPFSGLSYLVRPVRHQGLASCNTSVHVDAFIQATLLPITNHRYRRSTFQHNCTLHTLWALDKHSQPRGDRAKETHIPTITIICISAWNTFWKS